MAIYALYMYSVRKVILYYCHLDTSYVPGAIQGMLFSNMHRKVLFPAEHSL